jgi:hypothetical protein
MSPWKLTQVPVEAPQNGLRAACSLDSEAVNVFKDSKSYEFNTLNAEDSARCLVRAYRSGRRRAVDAMAEA